MELRNFCRPCRVAKSRNKLNRGTTKPSGHNLIVPLSLADQTPVASTQPFIENPANPPFCKTVPAARKPAATQRGL
jgi:hypothetical protein